MGDYALQLDHLGLVSDIELSRVSRTLSSFVASRFLVQLCGIVIGHLYFFLVFKYPQDFGGAEILRTPSFLYVVSESLDFDRTVVCFCRYRFFPNQRTGVSGFGAAPIPRAQPGAADDNANRGRGLFAGRGHVLGDH